MRAVAIARFKRSLIYQYSFIRSLAHATDELPSDTGTLVRTHSYRPSQIAAPVSCTAWVGTASPEPPPELTGFWSGFAAGSPSCTPIPGVWGANIISNPRINGVLEHASGFPALSHQTGVDCFPDSTSPAQSSSDQPKAARFLNLRIWLPILREEEEQKYTGVFVRRIWCDIVFYVNRQDTTYNVW